MRQELIKSCFDDIRLPDTSDGAELMEAHIFQPVLFAGGLSVMVLESSAAPQVVNNAKKFCRKWNVTLRVPGQFEFKGK